jgi:6-phosphogluconolactonase (cycloisomerase 2 family)
LIQDEVLNARNLSTYSDLENSVFKLIYKTDEGSLHVCARLAGLQATPLSLQAMDAGEILFNSNYESGTPTELSGSQCLIWMSKT